MRIRRGRRIGELKRIAEEQTALRNIATLIARGAAPSDVFDAVTAEVGRLLDVECSALCRYEPRDDGEMTIRVLSAWSARGNPDVTPAVGSRWTIPGSVSERVLRTGRSERVTYDTGGSGIAAWSQMRGIKSGMGSPIVVAGRLWGLSVIMSANDVPFPADTETRMSQFVELCGTAIELAESRDELLASRSRIVEAADTARRRIERDLHDGVQQRLISLGLELRLVESSVPATCAELKNTIACIAQTAIRIHEEVREIAHGVYPTALYREGLGAALRALARRSGVPVLLDVHDDRRLAGQMEITVYYAVSEALANVAKHAKASEVRVDLVVEDSYLLLTVSDDGIGGAEPRRGSGLTGLSDRVAVLGGGLEIISREGEGTTLVVEIPIKPRDGRGVPGALN